MAFRVFRPDRVQSNRISTATANAISGAPSIIRGGPLSRLYAKGCAFPSLPFVKRVVETWFEAHSFLVGRKDLPVLIIVSDCRSERPTKVLA